MFKETKHTKHQKKKNEETLNVSQQHTKLLELPKKHAKGEPFCLL